MLSMLHIFPFATNVRSEAFGTFQSYLDLVLVWSEVLVACEDICQQRDVPVEYFLLF